MVSAFAPRQRLVLGQVKVAENSNEIVAIPMLLEMLAIEGTIVPIDLIGCQRDIAEKILGKKANYVLALKGNPDVFQRLLKVFVGEQEDTKISRKRDRARPWPHRDENVHRNP